MQNYQRLDTAARLFPAVAGKNNSSVFRVAVILKEEVDPKTLQLAVNLIYERYHFFFLQMKRGVFWHYLDHNRLHFTVQPETTAPCSSMVYRENEGFRLKVLYHHNRISVEAFHSITDGSGIVEFLKSLVYYYLVMRHGEIDPQGKILLYDGVDKLDDEDSFYKNVAKDAKRVRTPRERNAVRLHGKKYRRRGQAVVTGTVSVSALKRYCKEHQCTITTLLVANMITSIAQTTPNPHKKPIVIAVPVNLRKTFHSSTLKNFFGVVNIRCNLPEAVTFEELLTSVSEQLTRLTGQEQLQNSFAKNVRLSTNVITKYAPLVVKNAVIPIGFVVMGELKKTMTISNVGQFDFPEGARPYIQNAEVLLYPTAKSPINTGICSFGDRLSITMVRSIVESEVLQAFFTNLASLIDSDVSVYSNDWGEENE